MEVYQESYYVPDDVVTGVNTGTMKLFGSVVRWAAGEKKGQIYKHLEPIEMSNPDDTTSFLNKAIEFYKENKREVLGIGLGLASIGVGIAIYKIIQNYEPKVVKDFRYALNNYVNAIKKGDLHVETINDLMLTLDKMRQHKHFDKISIKLSAEALGVMVGRIYQYTEKLANDNQYCFDNADIAFADNPIINLQECLKIQKGIFEAAA